MATFTAVDSGSDMMLLFSWVDGSTPIDQINIINGAGGQAEVRDQPFGGGYFILYTDTAPADFTATGTTPTGGTFATAHIYVYNFGPYEPRGTLSGITTTDNFAEIITEEAYRILDGDDLLQRWHRIRHPVRRLRRQRHV